MALRQQQLLDQAGVRDSLRSVSYQKYFSDGGFGIVESIVSALLLSVLIALGLTLSTNLKMLNTRLASGMQLGRQLRMT